MENEFRKAVGVFEEVEMAWKASCPVTAFWCLQEINPDQEERGCRAQVGAGRLMYEVHPVSQFAVCLS